MLFLICMFTLGIAVGIQIRNFGYNHAAKKKAKTEAQALAERASDANLAQTMTNALNCLEESAKALYPAHENDCGCAYCEIKHGKRTTHRDNSTGGMALPVDWDEMPGAHPDYVRALKTKNKQLIKSLSEAQNLIGVLQSEIDKRDRDRAREYREIIG